jgi:hypothetical protein
LLEIFLVQFQALSKFDVSGIGLNIGEVDDDNGVTSLRVLGVVHDSSAHAAGIKQVRSGQFSSITSRLHKLIPGRMF